MPLTSGAHHVAVFTADLDRLRAFYESVFGAVTLWDITEPGPGGGPLRHALIDLGGGFALHPFQMPSATGHEAGSMAMGRRGHIDHIALKVSDEAGLQILRGRLVEAGASSGTISDFGAVRLLTFEDPDGMEGEVALWTGAEKLLPMPDRRQEPWEG